MKNAKNPYAQPGDTIIEEPTLLLGLTEDRKYISLQFRELELTAIFTADEAEAFANAMIVKVRRIRQLAAEAPTDV